jgi:hypothetical protein
MVREQTQFESQISTPPTTDTSHDGLALAAADAWDPRSRFEQAPVFTKEALVAEQTKRAQEGRPLLGRFILEQPEGGSQTPGDYAKETIRDLRNALGRHINRAVLTSQGDNRAYVTIVDDPQGTEHASRQGDEADVIQFSDGGPGGGGGSGGGGGDDNSPDSPQIQQLENDQASYRSWIAENGGSSRAFEDVQSVSDEQLRLYFKLPFKTSSEEITAVLEKALADADGAAVAKLPPGASAEQMEAAMQGARQHIFEDLRDLVKPALARKFGLSDDATWLQIETTITDQYRQEAAQALGLHSGATKEEIVEAVRAVRDARWGGNNVNDSYQGIQQFFEKDEAENNPYK